MKTKIIIFLSIIILGLCGFGVWKTIQASNLREEYSVAVQNNKAYEDQLQVANEQNKVFQFTIDQLQYVNDSTIRQLDLLRNELKIKDDKIKQMGKIKQYVYITDSIFVFDTIFRDPELCFDTCLGDNWYHNHLHLEYPNKISSTIDVNTDQSVFLHTTRETINPPCKTWLGRLFQRKHDVYNVTVIEHNPYVNIKENKFIIIK